MKVFKFGGASVKNAEAVKNVCAILKRFPDEPLTVVVSAMDKTTNALEKVAHAYYQKNGKASDLLNEVRTFHINVMKDLFPDAAHPVYDLVNNLFLEVDWILEETPSKGFDFCYDQIVSAGELISTRIISEYLKICGIENQWMDARDLIHTDNTYREAGVDWELTCRQTNTMLSNIKGITITQGFIGSTSENFSVTLGREGSDYTAAILAHCLDAEAVYIWKDVPGVLNADPKYFNDAQKLDRMSYHDAVELAYFGASVIHPKTIKPLENKDIPLYVKSFIHPEQTGTMIGKDVQTKPLIPSFIFKDNQMLLSISAKDFSFIAEESLSKIFGLFAKYGAKINLMQNSAISFSVCIDHDPQKTAPLIDELMIKYKVLYNSGLQLYTVRHYYPSTIEMLTTGKEVLLEQRSRHTAQFVTRETGE